MSLIQSSIVPMLSDITVSSGDGFVHQLIAILIIGICVLLVWWAGTWFIGKLGAPAIVRTVWDGLFVLVGLIVIVNFLLGLTGHPFIKW